MLDKVDTVLESIDKLLETKDGVSEEVLAALVNELYNGVVKKYRPVIGVLPNVSSKVGMDIIPVIVAGLKIVHTVVEDVGFQAEMERGKKLKALNRFKSLKSYEGAGFTREEAMSLILADIANHKATWQKIESSTKTRSK